MAADASQADAPASSMTRILVVDDEADVLESLRRLLPLLGPGVNVEQAKGAQPALDRLRRGDIDLVITDFRMPGMDGVAFLRQAREVAPKSRRLMLTALASAELARKAFEQGYADDFVSKAAAPEELLEAVSRLLDPRSAQG